MAAPSGEPALTSRQWLLRDPDAQEAFGAVLARACPHRALIYLTGPLGAGKTTLVRGFLRARGETGPVRSPTYTLVEPYALPDGTVYHLDLYRLGSGEELEYLGLRDMLDETAVLLIEWPERGAGWLPGPDLEIRIEHDVEGRRLTLAAHSGVGELLMTGLADGIR